MSMSTFVKAAASALSFVALGVAIAEAEASFTSRREAEEKAEAARREAEAAASQEAEKALNHLRREAAAAAGLRQEVERLRRNQGGKRHHNQPE